MFTIEEWLKLLSPLLILAFLAFLAKIWGN